MKRSICRPLSSMLCSIWFLLSSISFQAITERWSCARSTIMKGLLRWRSRKLKSSSASLYLNTCCKASRMIRKWLTYLIMWRCYTQTWLALQNFRRMCQSHKKLLPCCLVCSANSMNSAFNVRSTRSTQSVTVMSLWAIQEKLLKKDALLQSRLKRLTRWYKRDWRWSRLSMKNVKRR